MEIRFRNYKRAVIILLLFLVTYAIGMLDIVEGSSTNAKQSITSDKEFELCVWIKKNSCVKSWEDEQNNTYFLFLPGAFKGKKLSLTFSGEKYIYIDGKK